MIRRMMTNFRYFLVLCLVSILFATTSCGKREAYYQFREMKNANWSIGEVITFHIDSTNIEVGVPYDISIEITNNVDYPYQNLWLFSEYNRNDSTTIKNQEEFILADQFGKWKGDGFASLYQSSHIVMSTTTFEEKKNYEIYVRHGMQDPILHGIEKVGIKIKRTK